MNSSFTRQKKLSEADSNLCPCEKWEEFGQNRCMENTLRKQRPKKAALLACIAAQASKQRSGARVYD
jgi:hypothetical protein